MEKPRPLYLEKNTTQSLNDRFSEVFLQHLTRRKVLFKMNKKPMVLRLWNVPRMSTSQGALKRSSVWTRIGWKNSWKLGVWNFRNKYRRVARFNPAPRSRFGPAPRSMFNPAPRSRLSPALSPRVIFPPKSQFSFSPKWGALRGVLRRRMRLGQARPFKGKSVQSRLGVATMGRGLEKKWVPSKKQLDAELDEYMSKTKSRLDEQLDQYMSLSRSRLDAELDEYMAMAPEGGGGALWQ
ncbi:uncharacterized protein [Eucyclogobius newberryi]|uniref:uncharacterized protein n=1 Tax=Eucyclogobius newberryi TaxID=166745 RepID=UPI003B590C27